MNSVLRWLNKNELLVHVVVTLLVFYGVPVAWLSFTNAGLVGHVINSALTGFTLIALFFVSFKAAVAVTDLVKIAVDKADLELNQDIATSHDKPKRDPVIDYTSPTMLVMDTLTKSGGSADITLVPQSSDVKAEPPAEKKKKRAPRSKSVKKEA